MLAAAVDDDIADAGIRPGCARCDNDIWLYVNSPGGSRTAGMAIHDTHG